MAYYNGRPCAACKHQRMKCTPQCILAPYFPPDDPEKKQNFLNVKEVYGVNNVKEILSALDPKDRAAAVTSLVYEAEIRLKEPVYGSVGYVAHLQQKLKSLNTELASAYKELASLSGPSTGTMPRQQPAAAYGQMVYDPLQQQRRMMGVQLSSPAAVPYGAATAATHQAQMMGVGNNPSGQQQQHGIGMDMRQYAAVLATDQHQLGVQLSSSAAQMDAPAVYGRAGTQIMMGVGLGNPSSSTSGQQQQYGIDVDARQYAALVSTHQPQPQPQPGVQLSSLAAQMGAPAVYGAGTQIMMGVGNNPSSSTSGQQQRYGIGVDAQQYAALVASHHHQQPGPYGMTQAQMMGTSDVYGGAGTSQQAEMMGVGNDPSSASSSGVLVPFTNSAPSQSQLIGDQQYGSEYVTTGDQVQRHDELARNYSYQLHNQQQGGLASSSVLLPYTNRTGAMTSDVYGGAGTSQQPQLTSEQQSYNQHEFGVLDYTQQYAAVAATDDQQYAYISSDHSGGENRRR